MPSFIMLLRTGLGRARAHVLLFILAVALACGFCVYFVSLEHPAYIWDWGGYFNTYIGYGRNFAAGRREWLDWLWDSIKTSDYNGTSIVPLLPLYSVFGDARIGYIAGVVALYLAPSAVILTYLTRLAADDIPGTDKRTAAIFVLALLYWPLWMPSLRGLPDVIGLIPLGGAALILLKSDLLTRRLLLNGILVGLLLWLTFLFRRWYAYACLCLMVSSFLFGAVSVLLAERRERLHRFGRLVLGHGVAGLTIVALLVLLQRELAVKMVTTSYAEVYAAYYLPFDQQLEILFGRAGLFLSVSIGLGLAHGLLRGNRALALCATTAVLTFLLFSRTQAPGIQHTLPVFFFLFPAFARVMLWLMAAVPAPAWIAATSFTALTAAIFVATFVPQAAARLALIRDIVPAHHIYPLRLKNFDEYQRLVADTLKLTDGGSKVAVISSSGNLADSLLESIDRRMAERLVWIAQVDARDGLKLAPLRAQYAIVTDPVGLHLPPGTQRVVSIPDMAILAGKGFGSAYVRVKGPYRLGGGLKAFIYERKRALSPADVESLLAELKKHYPNWRLINESLIR